MPHIKDFKLEIKQFLKDIENYKEILAEIEALENLVAKSPKSYNPANFSQKVNDKIHQFIGNDLLNFAPEAPLLDIQLALVILKEAQKKQATLPLHVINTVILNELYVQGKIAISPRSFANKDATIIIQTAIDFLEAEFKLHPSIPLNLLNSVLLDNSAQEVAIRIDLNWRALQTNNQYDQTEIDTLKKLLLTLMKYKGENHKKYIKTRFDDAKTKSNKAIGAMPSTKFRRFTQGFNILTMSMFFGGGALILTGMAFAIAFNVAALPIAAAICACVALLGTCIWAAGAILNQTAYNITAEKYNAHLSKAQNTLTKSVIVENTYDFLTNIGILEKPDAQTQRITHLSDPLLSNQQGPVFSIHDALNADPELQAVQETKKLMVGYIHF